MTTYAHDISPDVLAGGGRAAARQNRVEDFWARVEKTDGCWIWRGGIDKDGYGYFGLNGGHGVHRIAYELLTGPIPAGLHIDHLCRNRACVNPDHLEPVTQAENTRRGNAVRDSCKWGHPFDLENTIVHPVTGYRRCRECRRRRSRERVPCAECGKVMRRDWLRDHRLTFHSVEAS